jgi:phage portal protein BeeE
MAETIDVDNLTNLTTKNFFAKGAITNFVLSTEQKITRDQLKRLRAELRQDYSGVNNAYKTMILGGGLKPEKIAFSNKDMEFLSQLEWYRDKIMCGFGNTLASLGMLDDVNRATHESAMVEWKRTTVKPDMEGIVNALNEYLVPEFGDNLILGFTDPIPEDRADQRAEATELIRLVL